MGLKGRIALTLGFVICLIVAAFSFVVYSRLEERLLAHAAQTLKEHMEHEWRHLASHHGAAKAPSNTLSNSDVHYRLLRNGVVVHDSLPSSAGLGTAGRLMERMEKSHQGDKIELIGQYDLTSTRNYLAALRRLLIVGCLTVVFLVIPLSWLITRLLLGPFRALSAKTAELGAESLSFRFAESKRADEYGVLVASINALLNRLEKSFTQLRRFATNASHELRTPLSVIRSEAEVLLRRPREAVEYEAALKSIVSQVNGLQHVVKRLLFIADLERMGSEPQNTAIDVKRTITRTIESLSRAHPDATREIDVKAEGRPFFIGHRELFAIIIANLLENAVKYSRGKVEVHVGKDRQGLRFDVDDDGPGIPDTHKEEVFEPLSKAPLRAEIAARKTESHGLGLSIVKACVEAARGKVWLEDSPLGGLGVRVLLPDGVQA